jgi:hypothetical protein
LKALSLAINIARTAAPRFTGAEVSRKHNASSQTRSADRENSDYPFYLSLLKRSEGKSYNMEL